MSTDTKKLTAYLENNMVQAARLRFGPGPLTLAEVERFCVDRAANLAPAMDDILEECAEEEEGDPTPNETEVGGYFGGDLSAQQAFARGLK